ncbi:dihydroorotate dehydrogenase electron transfer subunit [Agrilactobacillus yilanensis]|uniref:Dihydroorotate dehydrogenase B (NAD(+)), electron transfer subunit n=1 Tax=Agrilactobacillus yilanensis TaxID=2485997 RepID=A0ABW4J9E7_9LACO|nr:dihydroorotate dehydrogenase electron transfer subunit [Agrilactobacillus yilanensis]
MVFDDQLTVIQQKEIAVGTFEMCLAGEMAKRPIHPGQFVNIQIPEASLRRPFGIAEVNQQAGYIKIIYRVVGAGTEAMAQLALGTKLQVLGPLGHGFPIDQLPKKATVLIVSGGTGLPPLYELTRVLAARGHQLDIALGFPTKNRVFYEENMAQFGHTEVITDDGTYQNKGLITDLLDQSFSTKSYDAVYACGPRPLELAVSQRFAQHPQAYISAEARMACGIGICNACVVRTPDNGYKKVCSDGPVFHVNEVIL